MYQSTTDNDIHTIPEEPEFLPENGDHRRIRVDTRRWIALHVFAIISTLLAITFLVLLVVIKLEPPFCVKYPDATIPRNFRHPGILDDITPQEMVAVRDFMLAQSDLELVPYDTATINSSYILLIDLHNAVKSSVTQYLDWGHKPPIRTAHVVVVRGDNEPPRVDEYIVFPLPRPDEKKKIYSPAYRKRPIPYTDRPPDALENKHIEVLLSDTALTLRSILVESYGIPFGGCDGKIVCLAFVRLGPGTLDSGERRTWYTLTKTIEGHDLHDLGLQVLVDHSSNHVTDWHVDRLVYGDHIFYDANGLMESYNHKALRMLRHEIPADEDLYSSYRRREWARWTTEQEAPRLTEPAGHRYILDGRHVRYKQWDFNYRMKTSSGLQLYDVRFQAARIAYEISLQDIVLFRSSHRPPFMASTIYGTPLMMGASSTELVRGVDCPDTASFVDSYHFVNTGSPIKIPNSICIFENNNNIPLRRHYARDFNGEFHSYGGLVDYTLVVRAIITLNSFDYILDYIFHANGVLNIQISTTGYIRATLNSGYETNYGNVIHENVVGGFHEHMFHFKVDLDVDETENRFSLIELHPKSEANPWFKGYNVTQFVQRHVMKTSEKHLIHDRYIPDTTKYVIYKTKDKHRFGTKKALSVENGCPSGFLLHEAESLRSAAWAKFPLAVTREKDFEQSSTSIYSAFDPFDPVVDFESFLADDVSLVDTDLVLWFAMAQHHIPHMEDVPSETTTGSQCAITIKPFNFYRESPCTSSGDIVRILTENGDVKFDNSGTTSGTYCAQKYTGYKDFNRANSDGD